MAFVECFGSGMQLLSTYFLWICIYPVMPGGDCRLGLTFVLTFSLTFSLVRSLPLPIQERVPSLLHLRVTIAYYYKGYSNHISNVPPATTYQTVPVWTDFIRGYMLHVASLHVQHRYKTNNADVSALTVAHGSQLISSTLWTEWVW
jgi:hypothetical protein